MKERDPQATTTTIKLRRAHLYSINCTLYLQSGSLWHSLSDMFFLENKFVQKKKNPHIQRSLWILSVRDRTTVKVSMFTITQKTWWTLNKVQRSRPGVKIDPSTSRWARWLRSSESDWGERRVEVEWDPKVFISVILWKCVFSNYKWRCMCVLELNLESLERGLFKNLKKKSRLAV